MMQQLRELGGKRVVIGWAFIQLSQIVSANIGCIMFKAEQNGKIREDMRITKMIHLKRSIFVMLWLIILLFLSLLFHYLVSSSLYFSTIPKTFKL